jgi:hypothetical protein
LLRQPAAKFYVGWNVGHLFVGLVLPQNPLGELSEDAHQHSPQVFGHVGRFYGRTHAEVDETGVATTFYEILQVLKTTLLVFAIDFLLKITMTFL